MNAKTMLFIDNHEHQIVVVDLFLKQGVCADYDMNGT